MYWKDVYRFKFEFPLGTCMNRGEINPQKSTEQEFPFCRDSLGSHEKTFLSEKKAFGGKYIQQMKIVGT